MGESIRITYQQIRKIDSFIYKYSGFKDTLFRANAQLDQIKALTKAYLRDIQEEGRILRSFRMIYREEEYDYNISDPLSKKQCIGLALCQSYPISENEVREILRQIKEKNM